MTQGQSVERTEVKCSAMVVVPGGEGSGREGKAPAEPTLRWSERLGRSLALSDYTDGICSRTSWLICLNSGEPARPHHSNKAASVEVSVAPEESMRRRASS